MKVSDFDYRLPPDLIAQEPAGRRDASRLLVLGREGGEIRHLRFGDLPALLEPGDLVVLNDTRVIPARLHATKPTGGKVRILLLERTGGTDREPVWSCLLEASKPPRKGVLLDLGEGVGARVLGRDGGAWSVGLEGGGSDPWAAVERRGEMPLPPYILREEGDRRGEADRERYQTVFARVPGAVAAPTAGLHFTHETFGALRARGVRLANLTLHVGMGTFIPVRSERAEDHVLHSETCELPAPTAAAVAETRRSGKRVVAVGTTVVRTLEWRAREDGTVQPGVGRCDLFILPGHRFRVVDALVTNFHLPRSTLLMLVCAFAGRDRVLAAYAEAIRERYRFYSYGDAMFVGAAR